MEGNGEKVSMKVVTGRSRDVTGRQDKETRVYDLLDRLGISYWRIDHEETASIEDCHGVDEALGISICKNLFLCNRQKTEFFLLMMPGRKLFRTKELSAQIDSSRLSFAPSEYMEEYLDITPGSVSVLGLMNDIGHRVRLLVDADILEDDYVGCHPCVNTSSLKIRTSDITECFLKNTGHGLTVVHL